MYACERHILAHTKSGYSEVIANFASYKHNNNKQNNERLNFCFNQCTQFLCAKRKQLISFMINTFDDLIAFLIRFRCNLCYQMMRYDRQFRAKQLYIISRK